MESPFSGTPAPDPSETDAQAALPRRRALMLGLAGVALEAGLLAYPSLLCAQPAAQPSAAPVADDGFLALSRALTDHAHLNPVTARRMRDALERSGVRQAGDWPRLAALAASHPTADALMAAARQAGLQDLASDIVAAWYTGTVGRGPTAVVVAYEEALMYQPVRDALTVPTYCSYGPLWWTAAPPDPAAMPPEPPLIASPGATL